MKNLTIAALAMLATNSAYANQSDLDYFVARSTVNGPSARTIATTLCALAVIGGPCA